MKNTFTIDADIKKTSYFNQPTVTSNDDITFVVNISDDGQAFDLADVTTVSLANTKPDNEVVVTPGAKSGTNQVTFVLGTNETAISGSVSAVVQLYDVDGRVSTLSFSYAVKVDPTGSGYVPSTDEQTLIEVVLNDGPLRIQEAIDAGVYATAQGDYALAQGDIAATESANLSTLKTDVQTATTSANTATTSADVSATNANTQGDYALAQGDYAKTEADRLVGTDVSTLDVRVTDNTAQLAQTTKQVEKFGVDVTMPPFNVKGDGTDETIAIQAAFDYAKTLRLALIPTGGSYVGTTPPVIFPGGLRYLISDEILIDAYSRIISDGQAIIEQTTVGKSIFKTLEVFNLYIEGIIFLKGKHAAHLSNANTDQTLIDFKNCQFQLQEDYTVYTMGLGYPASPTNYHMSANITFTKCRFTKPKKVLHNVCDNALMNDCWVFVQATNYDDDTSVFKNLYGSLRFDNMFGVPSQMNTLVSPRWIDNHSGSVFAENSRFGGEDGGMPIVYHMGDREWETSPTRLGASIIIKNSECYCGADINPLKGIIHTVVSIPQFVDISGSRIIRQIFNNSGGLNYDTYFGATAKGDIVKYRFIVTPNNIGTGVGAGSIPPQFEYYSRMLVRKNPTTPNTIDLGSQAFTILDGDILGGVAFSGQDSSSAGNASGTRANMLGVSEGTLGETAIVFSTTNPGSSVLIERHRIKSDGTLVIKGNTLKIETKKTPTSATASGTIGEICIDDNYIYICIATNTWKRSAILAW